MGLRYLASLHMCILYKPWYFQIIHLPSVKCWPSCFLNHHPGEWQAGAPEALWRTLCWWWGGVFITEHSAVSSDFSKKEKKLVTYCPTGMLAMNFCLPSERGQLSDLRLYAWVMSAVLNYKRNLERIYPSGNLTIYCMEIKLMGNGRVYIF